VCTRGDYTSLSIPIPPREAGGSCRNRAGSAVQGFARSFSITHTGSPPLILPLSIGRGRSSVIHAISIHPPSGLHRSSTESGEASCTVAAEDREEFSGESRIRDTRI